MVNILISGALGRMGRKVAEATASFPDTKILCGYDVKCADLSFPVFDNFENISTLPDVIIDFSAPSNLDNLLSFAIKNNIPCVLCATGYTDKDLEKIDLATQKIAIFRSANMSIGVNVLLDLVSKCAKSLYGFDIEIIEKHHNKKKDAPSGTAIMFADAVKKALPEKYYTYGRSGMVGERDKNEIGIHAVRGGNIVGEHEVIFAGENETVTISHQATDRSVFAFGAVNAAIFMKGKKCGLFNMQSLLNENA